jgi:hypothetical protein
LPAPDLPSQPPAAAKKKDPPILGPS